MVAAIINWSSENVSSNESRAKLVTPTLKQTWTSGQIIRRIV